MKILVVGGGGREHATVKSLVGEGRELYCAPGNAGIGTLAKNIDIDAKDIDGVVAFCKKEKIDLCVVSPDDPLVMGMVDALQKEGIRAFGPTKDAAIIEGSKAFAKDLMKKYGIPTAAYEVFTDSTKAIEYVKKLDKYPIVVKASGLALGKGVIIAENFEQARMAIFEMIDNGLFGESGSKIVIEEFLVGTEVSVLAFTDGKSIKTLTSAKDHKRVFDGDRGLNTGGMGVIAPNPAYTKEYEERAMKEILIPTVEAMKKEGRTFKGVLYFGLILTQDGPKVIEYNCRFGDPEAQVCLTLLKTDLLSIMEAVIDERLDEIEIETKEGSCICVMLVSGGYPEKYEKGKLITGLSRDGQHGDFYVFHSGTVLKDGNYYTNGGRVLGLTYVGKTLKEAQDHVYKNIDKITFENCFYRKDIGGKRDGI